MVSENEFPALPRTTLLAFGHRARQGKDEAAAAIVRAFPGLSIERFAFADPIKALARTLHGMRLKDGHLLQGLGDRYRAQDPQMFLKALYWTIAEKQPEFALITDLRTVAELDFIKALHGFTVKVERRNVHGDLVVPNDRDPNHPTETALAGDNRWDAHLTNHEGRLDDFRNRALAVFCSLTGTQITGRRTA
jgi:hypothetical protein